MLFPYELIELIDKNSLWGGLNIQKRKLCVNGILAQDLGFGAKPTPCAMHLATCEEALSPHHSAFLFIPLIS
jgi:hypothetical protein